VKQFFADFPGELSGLTDTTANLRCLGIKGRRATVAHGHPISRLGGWEGYVGRRTGSRFKRVTRRLSESVGRLCEVMVIRHVARYFGLHSKTVQDLGRTRLERS